MLHVTKKLSLSFVLQSNLNRDDSKSCSECEEDRKLMSCDFSPKGNNNHPLSLSSGENSVDEKYWCEGM